MNMMQTLILFTLLGAVSVTAFASQGQDFGQEVEALSKARSIKLFGIISPLEESSTLSISAAEADANPTNLVTLAKGLSAKVVSAASNLGPNIDQFVLWPNSVSPTHIIACNEQGSSQVGLQRINMNTGVVEDIVSLGLTSCDPVRTTAWGTIVFAEEAGSNGRVFGSLRGR